MKIIEKGMFLSDRCKFCGSFYEKIKPYICPYCWKEIKEVIAEYKDELLKVQPNSAKWKGKVWENQK